MTVETIVNVVAISLIVLLVAALLISYVMNRRQCEEVKELSKQFVQLRDHVKKLEALVKTQEESDAQSLVWWAQVRGSNG